MNKLIQTGHWFWRDNEISYKQFTRLTRPEKDAYVKLILDLEPSQRSTGDQLILKNQKVKEESYKFFEL